MTEHNSQVETIFMAALEIESPSARRDYLDQHCGENRILRQQVESLLLANKNMGSFLGQIPPACQVLENEGTTVARPKQIGRYRIEKVLGEGGFGLVYLAHDQQLDRLVAIKVPHVSLMLRPEDADTHFSEARTVANLDHPNIVPVYDIGITEKCRCYVVSKYIEGTNLATRLKQSRYSCHESAELVANVAAALHYAHTQGLVHRDVKPENILIGRDGEPYVVDFGLALRYENIGTGPRYAGTPAYMSPEQARGEGHRVDGRSDIFSLGVVFYELLAGCRPFHGETQAELLEQVTSCEPRPLRDFDESLPEELERICCKALARRASDRYSSSADLAKDLRQFIVDKRLSRGLSDEQSVRIVPRGLRSYDADDADFFLKLLPGPRDGTGLPDSLRFWKTRIEETDSENTFSVGLVYGPSGSGKSSLFKAGLLPRLDDHVTHVYIEATPERTAIQLLHTLRHRYPQCNGHATLTATLAAIRKGECTAVGKKILIVLDQFEHWLRNWNEGDTELLPALRQCDGCRVQCVVLVRDDFWMSATRFMQALEVPLVEAQNSATVDLFPVRHAGNVLASFGRAFGCLPDNVNDTSMEQEEFLKHSIAGLAENGKVICVRLALFAEMMKDKLWTPEVLKEVGGAKGLGVAFLDEKFGEATASPEYRCHKNAARAVLGALLPGNGTDIKGEMKSSAELQKDSGYANRPQDFNRLVRILDRELRLITPIDPQGTQVENDPVPQGELPECYYQLSHDFLVVSLREWLLRKRRETRRGRAEIMLDERSALWNSKPENRHLPSTTEWLRIQCLTRRAAWTEPQHRMIRRATRSKAIFWSGVLVVLLAAGIGFQLNSNRIARENTRMAIDSLQTASGNAIPFALENLDELPDRLVLRELQDRFPKSRGQQRLSLAYGLGHLGQVQFRAIVFGLLDKNTKIDEFPNVVCAFQGHKHQAISAIKAIADDVSGKQDWRAKSRLAVLAMFLDDLSLATEMLQSKPDPVERTAFISSFPELAFDAESLSKKMDRLIDPHFRSGVCLALGGIGQPDNATKNTWKGILENWYLHARDGGSHSAARWVLKQWQLDIPAVNETQKPGNERDWWHTPLGLRFVKIPAGNVQGEKKGSQAIHISDEFWLSDSEITTGLFQIFIDDDGYTGLKPDQWEGSEVFFGETSPDLPVQRVSWFEAIMFCNWLSWKLELEPHYEIEKQELEDSIQPFMVKRKPTDGVRLPTEMEWEFACRAMTTTRFYFGDDDRELGNYAWFSSNSNGRTHSVSTKRSNAWGLFDMHGNIFEWCWDAYMVMHRVGRGGGRYFNPGSCESSRRFLANEPTHHGRHLGFRVAQGPTNGIFESDYLNGWSVLSPTEIGSTANAVFGHQPDGSFLVSGPHVKEDVYTIVTGIDTEGITAVRLDLMVHRDLPKTGPGRHRSGNYNLTEISLYIHEGSPGREKQILFKQANATWSFPDHPVSNVIDGDSDTCWHVEGRTGDSQSAVFHLETPLPATDSNKLTIRLIHGGGEDAATLGRFRLSVKQDNHGGSEQ